MLTNIIYLVKSLFFKIKLVSIWYISGKNKLNKGRSLYIYIHMLKQCSYLPYGCLHFVQIASWIKSIQQSRISKKHFNKRLWEMIIFRINMYYLVYLQNAFSEWRFNIPLAFIEKWYKRQSIKEYFCVTCIVAVNGNSNSVWLLGWL